MAYSTIFKEQETSLVLDRLSKLSNDTAPQWGKMNAAQMLAHLNVAYGIAFGEIDNKVNPIMKFVITTFFKSQVCGDKPYKKNMSTPPVFKISDEREFIKEKGRLTDYLKKAQQLGPDYFEGKKNPAFGQLSSAEWSTLFHKHIDHHFSQFGI